MSAARTLAVLLVVGLLPLLALLAGAVAHDLGRRRHPAPRAAELPRQDHPGLWKEVDALAAGLGVDPPDRLLADLRVAVSLRLVGGRRELRIGLPQLAATSRGQLRALVAAELAHDARGSWSTALARRAQEGGTTATAAIPDGAAHRLLVRLVRPYLRAAGRVAWDQVLTADADAAHVVGSQAVASSLRRAAELDVAWDALHREYVPLADSADRRPALVHGLHHVLGARTTAIEEEVAALLDREAPHAPLALRLQALLAVPVLVAPDPRDDAAACTLLDGGFGRLEQLEAALHGSALPSAPWGELVTRAGLARCAERTAALARSVAAAGLPAPVTLAGVLEAVGRGEASRLPAAGLAAAVAHSLCLSGGYVHRVSWTGPGACRLTSAADPEQLIDVEGLMTHVLADPSQVPELCRLLERHGAALGADLTTVTAGATVLEGVATALVGADRRRYDLVACSTGLLVLPSRTPLPWQLGVRDRAARAEQAEQQRVAELLAAGLPALRGRPGARWIATQEVLAGRLQRRRASWVLEVRVRLGLPLELRSTPRTRQHGTPLDTALSVLADRAGDRAWQASALGVAVPA